jgi:hypothetical protein
MKWSVTIALALVATGCSQEPTQAELAAERERQVEMVRRANDAPPLLVEVTPETIAYDDIERWDLAGASCSYAPGTSLGARVIAREADAFMKLDGEVIRFAADSGSRELPARSRSVYNGGAYSLRLDIAGAGEGADATMGEGSIWLRDRWDRVVYQGNGTVSCTG